MPLPSTEPTLITSLDYMSDGYWQDFLAKRSIAGGIAYESALQDCTLDESLLSLQRVDMLLSQLRRDLIQTDKWHEQAILADNSYRNLFVFLAFYAGRVLARQSENTAHWYGKFELRERYPQLHMITDNFYQHMALSIESSSFDTSNKNSLAPIFFALEPIGMRIFGHIDRQFHTVFGGQVAGGLYQAVTEFLSDSTVSVQSNFNSAFKSHLSSKPQLEPVVSTVSSLSQVSKLTQSTPEIPMAATQQSMIEPVAQTVSAVPLSPTVELPNVEPLRSKSLVKPIIVTPEIFTQLLIELDEIEVVQTAGNSEYQQACKILDQFERHIAKQDKPRAQVMFSETHQHARQRALQLLVEAATAGNSAAMARLAMYELLGEGLTADKDASEVAGIEWVKQAASANDSRAQRLLSKLYYQGVGVSQDMDAGKLWLEQAAKNGHPEAATVIAQWQQAQALISVQQKEQHSIKRYQLLIAAIAIAALLLIIFV
ncbi:tetratricopeptide repeat protein [Psychrobacter sp. 16-MNA-CIBAN-0192]|uniref:tetratricopeptide repeat protein n=1 Tax=Psychrobacter sp. 16-MNA-CIBAN-0192 TaxID=3140448 RepID=UPI003318EAA1